MSMLVKYVRDDKNHRIGVVVAMNKTQIGWSRCNKKDKFDKLRGLGIAINRAQHHKPTKSSHSGMVLPVAEMQDRAQRYYKEGVAHEN